MNTRTYVARTTPKIIGTERACVSVDAVQNYGFNDWARKSQIVAQTIELRCDEEKAAYSKFVAKKNRVAWVDRLTLGGDFK